MRQCSKDSVEKLQIAFFHRAEHLSQYFWEVFGFFEGRVDRCKDFIKISDGSDGTTDFGLVLVFFLFLDLLFLLGREHCYLDESRKQRDDRRDILLDKYLFADAHRKQDCIVSMVQFLRLNQL